MKSRIPRALAAVGAAALLVPFAAAADEADPVEPVDPQEPEIELVTQETFYTCNGETPEDTVNRLVLSNPMPSWSTSPPDSVTTGAGCGSANPSTVGGVRPDTPFDLNFAGFFRGYLDSLTVSLHNSYLGRGRTQDQPVTLDVRMSVGSQSLFGVDVFENVEGVEFTEPAVRRVVLTPEPTGDTGAVERWTFTVTDIGLTDESHENRNHYIVMTFATPFGQPNLQNVWLWGAEEAPSGVVFNPEEPAEVTTPADREVH